MPALSERFDAALVFASALHREQRRKSTETPYVSHLLAVAGLVLEHGGSEDEAIAALLHDAVEDQGGEVTAVAIRARFGDEVHAIVLACSDAVVERGQEKPPWRARKERYHAHVRHAPPAVLLVSAADKLHNARTLLTDLRAFGEPVWGRFSVERPETLWNFRQLVEAYRARPLAGRLEHLVEELDRTVSALERWPEPTPPEGP